MRALALGILLGTVISLSVRCMLLEMHRTWRIAREREEEEESYGIQEIGE